MGTEVETSEAVIGAATLVSLVLSGEPQRVRMDDPVAVSRLIGRLAALAAAEMRDRGTDAGLSGEDARAVALQRLQEQITGAEMVLLDHGCVRDPAAAMVAVHPGET